MPRAGWEAQGSWGGGCPSTAGATCTLVPLGGSSQASCKQAGPRGMLARCRILTGR